MAAGAVFAEPLKAATAEPSAVTPALIEAARKEGKISFYTALELPTSERLGKAFEAKYPGIAVRVERSGAERIFQRIGQEQASRIYAVNVVCSTDPAHFLDWKSKDWVAPYVPEDVTRYFPPEHVDPSGMHAMRLARSYRLQHESRRAGGCPEELCRPARPQVAGQARKGPPGL